MTVAVCVRMTENFREFIELTSFCQSHNSDCIKAIDCLGLRVEI